MLAITVNHLNDLFFADTLDPFASEEVNVFLPAVKIIFDWMYANKSLWYPPPQVSFHGDLSECMMMCAFCLRVYTVLL